MLLPKLLLIKTRLIKPNKLIKPIVYAQKYVLQLAPSA